MFGIDLPSELSVLEFVNLVFSSAILILSFSLFVYVLTFNLHSHVGRAFAALLLGVVVVYTGDLVLPNVDWQENWLRFQWIGIALVPAAYLHFSRAVLLATWLQPDRSTWQWLIRGSYALSGLFALLALFTDVLVRPATGVEPVAYLQPGPLFPIFTLYFVVCTLWGGWNLLRARARARTAASRRRLNYLLWSFVAPALGVFPYLILASRAGAVHPAIVLTLAIIANLAVGLMLVVMTYSVAYYGVLSPDRTVKRQLAYFLLRGPVVAVIVIGLILTIPKFEGILGVPPDTALTVLVVGAIVLAQVAITILQPTSDRALYRNEADEVQWLRTLETRLMTSGDLHQFLENVLVTVCDAFQVSEGFFALPGENSARIEALVGSERSARALLSRREMQALLTSEMPIPEFHLIDGYYIRPLIGGIDEHLLGIVAVRQAAPSSEIRNPDDDPIVQHLLRRAEIALEDRRLQLDVYDALRPILPDIEVMQALRGTVAYVLPPSEQSTDSLVESPEFIDWVRDALNHYWGGPKLSSSPLLGMSIVRQALADNENSPTRALRAVLQSAVERQRPPGERQMTTSEWLLYNILDLKFVQGRRVREIADRLAMSESDLYRKQRVAITEVARTLAEMETSSDSNGAAIMVKPRSQEAPQPT